MGAVIILRLEGGSIGPSTESCINCDGQISILLCLHQGNIYIKMKLQVWRDKKCIPLVGGITPLNCAGRHNTPSRRRQPSTESCINCDGPISMVPCLHQGNIYIKRKLRVWRDHKCIPLLGAIIPLTCVGRENTTSRGNQYWAQYGKLHKL